MTAPKLRKPNAYVEFFFYDLRVVQRRERDNTVKTVAYESVQCRPSIMSLPCALCALRGFPPEASRGMTNKSEVLLHTHRAKIKRHASSAKRALNVKADV